MKKITVILLSISIILVFGHLSDYSVEAKEKDPIKIGVLLPLSGPLALEGGENLRGYEIARRLKNEKGGIWGRPLEFVKGDASSVKAAMGECERLITVEGVKVILGTYSSSLSFATTTIAERYGVVYFETSAVADAITERGLSHIFRTGSRASIYSRQAVTDVLNYVLPLLKMPSEKTRFALVHENSTFGTSCMVAIEDELKKKNLQIVMKEQYDNKSQDLSSVIMKCKDANPDVLFLSQYVRDAILFNRQSKELNFNVKVINSTAGINITDFVKGAGRAGAEGLMATGYPPFNLNPKFGADKIEKIYRNMYPDRDPSPYALDAFVGAKVALDILDRAGSLDDKVLIKSILETDIPMGALENGRGAKFNPPGVEHAGQNIRSRDSFMQWQDGKLRVIGPPDMAEKGISIRTPIPTWEEKNKIFK